MIENRGQNSKQSLLGKRFHSLKSYARTDKVNVFNIAIET